VQNVEVYMKLTKTILLATLGLTISAISAFADLQSDAITYGLQLAERSRLPGEGERTQEDYNDRMVKAANMRGYHSQNEVDSFIKIAWGIAGRKGAAMDAAALESYKQQLIQLRADWAKEKADREAKEATAEAQEAAQASAYAAAKLHDWVAYLEGPDLNLDHRYTIYSRGKLPSMIEINVFLSNDQTYHLMNNPFHVSEGNFYRDVELAGAKIKAEDDDVIHVKALLDKARVEPKMPPINDEKAANERARQDAIQHVK
jgi:hypothetical protein